MVLQVGTCLAGTPDAVRFENIIPPTCLPCVESTRFHAYFGWTVVRDLAWLLQVATLNYKLKNLAITGSYSWSDFYVTDLQL
jgi:hypothetical protein